MRILLTIPPTTSLWSVAVVCGRTAATNRLAASMAPFFCRSALIGCAIYGSVGQYAAARRGHALMQTQTDISGGHRFQEIHRHVLVCGYSVRSGALINTHGEGFSRIPRLIVIGAKKTLWSSHWAVCIARASV